MAQARVKPVWKPALRTVGTAAAAGDPPFEHPERGPPHLRRAAEWGPAKTRPYRRRRRSPFPYNLFIIGFVVLLNDRQVFVAE